MQTLLIGDIHGCFLELQALLEKAALTQGDAIISLGDCVDRGPETPQVLNFFKEHPNAQVLMGNHERKHVRGSRGEVALARSQQISRIQFGETYLEALEFMSRLPMFIDLPEALLVHGYFEPGLSKEQQTPMVICGHRSGEHYLQARYERPWYELYDGDKPIVVGHQNYTGSDQPFVYRERVFGLDTSCVTGQALTGLLLPSFRFISMPSRGDLWGQVANQHPRLVRELPSPPAPVAWSKEDEQALMDLVPRITQLSQTILHELESEPGYAALHPREQARLFGKRAGPGPLGSLLQLSRMGKLEVGLAHRVLRNPEALRTIIQKLNLEG
jgi:hypothetical protein